MRHYPATGARRDVLLVLAHGAGAGEAHPFMVACAQALAADGIDVVTFNFPYIDAGRRVPDRASVLEGRFREAVAEAQGMPDLGGLRLVIGGKSMGGRMATHLAAQGVEALSGVVALGYPLHPPGKPEALRVAHLATIAVPMLVVQGERDAFGSPAELVPHMAAVPGGVRVHVIAGGDHSFSVRGRKPEAVRAEYADAITSWLAMLPS